MSLPRILLVLTFLLITKLPSTLAQTPAAEAPAPASDSCNGVYLSYTYTSGFQIPPVNATHQPYRFESTLTVLNNGPDELKLWRAFVGFQHDEILVSVSNAVLEDGSTFPATVGGNGTVFLGYPNTDLKSAIETAGDVNQMRVQVKIVGTQFGVKSPSVPMPKNISLGNDGWSCPTPTLQGTSVMEVCCTVDPSANTTVAAVEEFLPRQSGDLTFMYDVIRTYDSSYWAQVTIANHNPLGRLDNWKLSWDWTAEEFIYTMKGAYPYVVDSSECIFGPQGNYYQQMDFSNVLNCERRPTIIDLPPTKANDTTVGLIPNCCRNGTILPPNMNASQSTSVFQMQVYKMPPNLNRSMLLPPINWKINGTLNPDFQCGQPRLVSPSQFIDPSGLPSNTTAVASWQVVCNITQAKGSSPKCCVSFSAYYNDSVVPCKTCACGCPASTSRTCSTTASAMLLPSEALLVPFDNRTSLAVAWSELKHRTVPSPMPCGDNCGVSMNWHIATDYSRGWTARITIFNWDDIPFADWFAAVQMDKAAPGFEAMYSFNGSVLPVSGINNTIFMEGLPGLNYLVAETDGSNPQKDPRVPGKQQTVISFTKKNTPGIDVSGGDGFPTKVYFNGEECALPSIFPANNSNRAASNILFSIFFAILLFMFIWQWLEDGLN